ncbi:MAG TPA: aminopeptidase P family N-terminal domain-containing protein, partial [Xanthobacteraceae bacterium]
MRRGLMRWDENELPKAVLLERRARLQAAMRRDRLDGLLIYTNLVRPSAVCWLTGFTPYWIDSLLLVPQDGPPILATALSKRVADWVRSTSYIDEIVNTPRPGSAIGQRLAANGASRIGVLEFDALPGGLFDDLAVAAPAVELSDASEAFTSCRRPIDAAERKLIARADAVAKAALDQPQLTDAGDAGELAGAIEKHARLNAAEEAYIAVAPDLDADRRLIRVTQAVPLGRRFAVRASVAYKGSWV